MPEMPPGRGGTAKKGSAPRGRASLPPFKPSDDHRPVPRVPSRPDEVLPEDASEPLLEPVPVPEPVAPVCEPEVLPGPVEPLVLPLVDPPVEPVPWLEPLVVEPVEPEEPEELPLIPLCEPLALPLLAPVSELPRVVSRLQPLSVSASAPIATAVVQVTFFVFM